MKKKDVLKQLKEMNEDKTRTCITVFTDCGSDKPVLDTYGRDEFEALIGDVKEDQVAPIIKMQ